MVDIILPWGEHGLEREPYRAVDPVGGREHQRAHLAVNTLRYGEGLHGGHAAVARRKLRRAHRKAPPCRVGRARQQRCARAAGLERQHRRGGGVAACPPAADAQRVPACKALPGLGHGEAVRAVREQRAARRLCVHARALDREIRQRAAARLSALHFRTPAQRRCAKRQALGQQAHVRTHGGVCQKPALHLPAAQRVAR